MKIKLRIVQGRPAGKSIVFPHGEYVFGRGTECHVRPNSDWVSRQHCLLRVTTEGAFLRDLGSRNGTLINGARLLAERQLEDGDQLQVGPLVFEVLLDEAITDTVPAAAVPERGVLTGDTVVAALDTAEVKALAEGAQPTREESVSAVVTPPDVPAVVRRGEH